MGEHQLMSINFGPSHRGNWRKVNQRVWDMEINRPEILYPDYLWLEINKDTAEWGLSINSRYIASFHTFDEADKAAPMLLKLYGYQGN